ncbi:Swarming motility protein SwrC [Thalassovita gelatinovora]|uniref:Swarming motility protein SwrC n=1 Tax=Thalassovita gelatinovora TaxID=53501 RepID=A0A0P1F8Q9_THAGE|nr:efflux RND transporter permease subunit [Thalassovita gelatinovora]QIZ81312.1 efflux RND transporter permease subunit [Thalassovita gelatinovora]CUH64524.1 Swarming motility protein SwrC [Thalassovita gelatinovora]SEP96929.1 Multidrug efflux pump subunit AcrB [Thalassovita gelatinovora]
MKSFNLSDWALKHRSFTWFLMIVSMIAGAFSYASMGREEDPSFTIPTMVVAASMPGATAEEMLTQVTDRIEQKLQELDGLDITRSVTYPGQTVVYVDLGDSVAGEEIDARWLRVRNLMSDIRGDFPQEFQGFAFNDDFGDVYGNVYAFTADGFSPDEVKTYAEHVRDQVQALDAAGKVDLIGTRDRVVHIEFSTTRLAAFGLDGQSVLQAIAAQNQIVPSGSIQTERERILIRVSGQFDDVDALANAPLRIGSVFFTLADVANVTAGYADPPSSLVRYNGEEAIGLIVGMREGENILTFGEDLDRLMERLETELPIGIEIHKIADQPHVVEESVSHFLKALAEAVVIVLAVSFVSLGVRAGFIVSLTIPLVLALTFVVLDAMGITLQRISLGALIIALGLLVDDAMITIETMISRLELGDTRRKAASHAWTSIAWPMLSGTLITAAGFIPIGLNGSAAGEYTISLFYVIGISLLISWFVAVMFAPVLGATFLPKDWKHHDPSPGPLRRVYHRILRFAMRLRYLTIMLTIGVFAVSVVGLGKVEQQFFPISDRPEIVVDVSLRQNVSFFATDAEMAKFDNWLGEQEGVEFWTTYIGDGAPRFVLTLQGPTAGPHVGQVVIMTTGSEARDRLAKAIADYSDQRIGVEFFAKFIELGPPVGKPVQYRITGPDTDILRDSGRDLAAVLAGDARLHAVSLDWNEPVRVVRVNLDQARLRQLGLTQSDVAGVLASLFEGSQVTQLRKDRDLIDVLMRGEAKDRTSLAALQNLQFASAQGVPIPLSSIATLEWVTEQPILYQRNREPVITVSAAILTKDQPATIVTALEDDIAAFQASLPRGYNVAVGGTVAESADSQAPILAAVPIMVFIILLLTMMQVQSFRTMFVVMAVAPLGLIGVVPSLLISGAPLGFVAFLGVLALIGILIRNSIILAQAIDDLIAEGKSRWDAVFLASDQRARPILLTAAAASLALIPISRQVFWGPMAYAMMGGIIAGTLITLIFAPALYVAVYRVRPTDKDAS